MYPGLRLAKLYLNTVTNYERASVPAGVLDVAKTEKNSNFSDSPKKFVGGRVVVQKRRHGPVTSF